MPRERLRVRACRNHSGCPRVHSIVVEREKEIVFVGKKEIDGKLWTVTTSREDVSRKDALVCSSDQLAV